MKLEVEKGGWIDRIKAATQVKMALVRGVASQDYFAQSILDVVCSQAEVEVQEQGRVGVSKVSCTFYIRIPAFLGLVAFDHWIPRINMHNICGCTVESYLFFGDGKEPRGGTRHQDAWSVTVDGVTPNGTGFDPRMVRTSVYNPEGTEAEYLMNMALMHGKECKQREEIGDYAWVKNLKLADKKCVPACEEDMKKLEDGRTWQHWEYICSGDPDKVWTALGSLKAAGEGEIRDGKWMMFIPEHYYTLYLPDRRGLSGDEA